MHAGAVICCRSADDAIVVIRVALRFHQGLLASGGTAGEVGVLGIALVISMHDLFCDQCHFVGGAVSPVSPALRAIDEDAGGLARRRRHAHISVGHCVAAPQPLCQGVVGDGAGKAAIAGAFETLVPAGLRHPDLDADVGVRAGLQRGGDTTEGWKTPQ